MRETEFIKISKKNYELVKRYLIGFKNKENIFKIDMEIQTKKIKEYLKAKARHGIIDNDKEVYNWIKKYSSAFRTYLNSIKMLAEFFHITINNIEELDYEYFKKGVEIWNHNVSLNNKNKKVKELTA